MNELLKTYLVKKNGIYYFNVACVIRDYTQLLIKSDCLQLKLETLYNKLINSQPTKKIMNHINKLNDCLNGLLVKVINLQYIINYHNGCCAS